jgi:hypothetical protein
MSNKDGCPGRQDADHIQESAVKDEIQRRLIDVNPSRFEELAGVIATALAYLEDGNGLDKLYDDFSHIYRRALDQPPCYTEVNEITGQSLSAGDRMAGQSAWMLQNIDQLNVYGVHSQLWHEVHGSYTAPLLDQIGEALGMKPQFSAEDIRRVAGDKKSLVDVVGVKSGDSVWIVQTIWCNRIVDSAVTRGTLGTAKLFKSRVFDDPTLDGQNLKSLLNASYFMRRAFPGVTVATLCMVLHRTKPDFELYQVDLPEGQISFVKLEERMVRKNSIDYSDVLRDDWEALLTLPHKLDNDLFRGLPPCKGGRTLGILASTAKRQLASESLLLWKEQEVSKILKEDFGYVLPRDKVRHDLVDRLVGNGFMRKGGSEYSLTMKGVARYLYCLAKYTTKAITSPDDVIEECGKQRRRALEQYHRT